MVSPPKPKKKTTSKKNPKIKKKRTPKIKKKKRTVIENDYQFLKTLGKGAFGKVVKAKHKKTNELVAIKFQKIHKHSKIWVKEIQVLKKISQICKPFVCIKGYGKIKGLYYIIMELIEGVNLKDFIQNHDNIPNSTILSISKQLIYGIKILHNAGLAHMDIKPTNIMIKPETNEIQIIDLGLSCFEFECGESGTSAYMEKNINTTLTGRQASDIWAIGICIIQLILGYYSAFAILEHEENIPREINKRISDPLFKKILLVLFTRNYLQRIEQFNNLVI